MKAIVMTYDKNAVLTEHMIQCYNELWPNHPFTFRVPYQQESRLTPSGQTEYIKTPKEIKPTVLTLLEDLDDEEWIYWCIDDKYPIQLRVPQIEEIYHAVINNELDETSSVLFCRARWMLKAERLTGEKITSGNHELLERNSYHNFWIHQFAKVKMIRHLFLNFPDVIETPRVMDPLKHTIKKPDDHKFYVTSVNHAVFGESASYGLLTENCYKSMKKRGIKVPAWYKINHKRYVTMGELEESPAESPNSNLVHFGRNLLTKARSYLKTRFS